MQLETKKYVYDIQQAASLIVQFTEAKTFADYQQDSCVRRNDDRIVWDVIEQKLPALHLEATRLIDQSPI